MTAPSQPSVAGKLTEAEALVDAFEKRRGESMFTADRNLLRDTAATILAEREATLRAQLAAAIEAQCETFRRCTGTPPGQITPSTVAYQVAARIVRTTEGTGGETA